MPAISPRKDATLQDLLFLVPLTLLFLFYGLGSGSLASWDEAYYAVVSRELLRSRQWLDLYFTGALWFEKPPLAFWATAFFYKLFGISEFTARLFSAACGAGTVLLTYFFGRKLFNRWTGLCGALVLLSSSHFLRFSRFGMLDAPLTFFLTLALFFFWLGRTDNRLLFLSGLPLGLAILTKGVVGVLVIPVVWVYCLGARRFDILKRPAYWGGIALACATALPWYLYETLAHPGIFFQNALVNQVFLRATTVLADHKGNSLFYLRVLVNKYHPWILLGVISAPLFLWKAFRDGEDESVFVASWIFVVFALFSLAKTKLAWYIFPLYPALSLSVAYVFTLAFKEKYAAYAKFLFVAVLALQQLYSHILQIEYSRPVKAALPLIEKNVPRDATVYLYRYHEQPAAVFYFDRKVAHLDTTAELEAASRQGKDFYCLVRTQDLKEVAPHLSGANISSTGPIEGLVFLAEKAH